MEPLFSPPQRGSDTQLLCPKCLGQYLRHVRIEVFERAQDDEQGVHVTVEGGKATVDTIFAGIPSAHRQALRIQFRCEGCSATPVLTLAQDMGNTLVDIVP